MNILVTGATGYIGQSVCARLLGQGHDVAGLVRSDAGLRALAARGIRPVRGSLADVPALAQEVLRADAVVDTASADHADATSAFLDLLAGTGKAYIRTSGTGIYTDLAAGVGSERVYDDSASIEPAPVVAERYASDLRVIEASTRDVRTVVIRPSMIYGDGASEQLPLLIRHAIASGNSIYVAPGENIWSNVYLPDLVDVYVRALDKAPPGAVYNIAGGEARMRDIASWIAALLDLPGAVGVTRDEAHTALGARWVDVALASNSRVDSTRAREELGWIPRGPDLATDLVHGSYKRLWSHKGDPHDHVSRHGADSGAGHSRSSAPGNHR